VQGPGEWVDTSLIFDLKSADGQTVVVFSHAGWREPVEFIYPCSSVLTPAGKACAARPGPGGHQPPGPES
jgi:hypothetical protein